MNEPLDEAYLTWLYSQVCSVKLKTPSRTYWGLFRQLFSKEFVWFVPNDDNRVEDGRDLRYEFFESEQIDLMDEEWMGLGCSMLEMIIALARRLAFEDGKSPRAWFWRLMDNLNLERYSDAHYNSTFASVIDQTLDQVIWRTYGSTGDGGLFPLEHPKEDQREVEIWYQLSAYLLELE